MRYSIWVVESCSEGWVRTNCSNLVDLVLGQLPRTPHKDQGMWPLRIALAISEEYLTSGAESVTLVKQ